jgi:N-dimethylarginine dimethylaminohydrolase
MKIQSYNEWDRLREVVVGRADHANWPSRDPVFAQESSRTDWKETPVPAGPVPQHIIDEANEDLEALCAVLASHDVIVNRPDVMDWQARGGFGTYSVRDRLLIAGNVIVDPAMMYPCRDQEIQALGAVIQGNPVIPMPRGKELILDAANVCRLGSKWLYLESRSGSRAAGEWLAERFPQIDIHGCNFYSGVHIDSTLVPLREGLIMINAERVKPDQLPRCLDSWEKIWVEDVVAQDFYQYPWASKWIGMNCLSIDSETVIMDAAQTDLINRVEQYGITVIPLALRHARTLGGGFHCVTLDTWRENR